MSVRCHPNVSREMRHIVNSKKKRSLDSEICYNTTKARVDGRLRQINPSSTPYIYSKEFAAS